MTHLFTKGEYKTRRGYKAVLVQQIEDQWLGYIQYGEDHKGAQWWTLGGKRWDNDQDEIDLLPPASEPETVVRWVNLYRDGGEYLSSTHGSLQAALPNTTSIECIARARVVLTLGQFDDESAPSEWDQAIETAAARLEQWDTNVLGEHQNRAVVIRALKRRAA